MSGRADLQGREAIAGARAELHAHGMRWTPQRRLLVEILLATRGHVTGTELVERCRRLDPETTPSTVYRTLDALEEIGLVRHSHGSDGREEYHVLPTAEHGHLRCEDCGATWEIDAEEASQLMRTLAESRGFALNLSHLTIVGRCAGCGEHASGQAEHGTPQREGSAAHG
jgi:Fur family transcriptional regulator, ferric uptake regulator